MGPLMWEFLIFVVLGAIAFRDSAAIMRRSSKKAAAAPVPRACSHSYMRTSAVDPDLGCRRIVNRCVFCGKALHSED